MIRAWCVLQFGLCSWIGWRALESEVQKEYPHQVREFTLDTCDETLACLSAALEHAAKRSYEDAESSLRSCPVHGSGDHATTHDVIDTSRKLVQQLRDAEPCFGHWSIWASIAQSIITVLCIIPRAAFRERLTELISYLQGENVATPKDAQGFIEILDRQRTNDEHVRIVIGQITDDDIQTSRKDVNMPQAIDSEDRAQANEVTAETVSCCSPHTESDLAATVAKLEVDLIEMEKRARYAESRAAELEAAHVAVETSAAEQRADSVHNSRLQELETKQSVAPRSKSQGQSEAAVENIQTFGSQQSSLAEGEGAQSGSSDDDASIADIANVGKPTIPQQIMSEPLALQELSPMRISSDEHASSVNHMASPASPGCSNPDLDAMYAFAVSSNSEDRITVNKKCGFVNDADTVAVSLFPTRISDELAGLQRRLTAVSDEREVLKSELLVAQREVSETRADNEVLFAQVASLNAKYVDLAKDAQKKLVDAALRERFAREKGKRSFWG